MKGSTRNSINLPRQRFKQKVHTIKSEQENISKFFSIHSESILQLKTLVTIHQFPNNFEHLITG